MKQRKCEINTNLPVNSSESSPLENIDILKHPERIVTHYDALSVLFTFEKVKRWNDVLESGLNFKQYSQSLLKTDAKTFKCCCSEASKKLGCDILVICCSEKFVNESYNSVCEPTFDYLLSQSVKNVDLSTYSEALKKAIKAFIKRRDFKLLTPLEYYPYVYGNSTSTSIYMSNDNISQQNYLVDKRIIQWEMGNSDASEDIFPTFNRSYPFEHIDYGGLFYRNFFYRNEHWNYCGFFPDFGPICISVAKEKPHFTNFKSFMDINLEVNNQNEVYFFIMRSILQETVRLRIPGGPFKNSNLKSSIHHKIKDMIELIYPQLNPANMFLELDHQQFEEALLKFDEQSLEKQYKIGVLYCKVGQETEEDIYSNNETSPLFYELMNLLAKRVKLKGFTGYNGVMDVNDDLCGTESYYTDYGGREIMFQVAPMIPQSNENKTFRKSKLGNDAVNIIFQEPGCSPINPAIFITQYTQTFIIIRPVNNDVRHPTYTVSVTRTRFTPFSGPEINQKIFKHNAEFREFILTKAINYEYASHISGAFEHRTVKMRKQNLMEMMNNVDKNCSLDALVKGRTLFPKKPKQKQRFTLSIDFQSPFATAHPCTVEMEQFLNEKISCIMVISLHFISFLDPISKRNILSFLLRDLSGWAFDKNNHIRLYYECFALVVELLDSDRSDSNFIMNRFYKLATDDKLKTMTIDESCPDSSYEILENGELSDVTQDFPSKSLGLDNGCVIMEINDVPYIFYTHSEFRELMRSNKKKDLLYRAMPRSDCRGLRKSVTLPVRRYHGPRKEACSMSMNDQNASHYGSEHTGLPKMVQETEESNKLSLKHLETTRPRLRSVSPMGRRSEGVCSLREKYSGLTEEIGSIIKDWDQNTRNPADAGISFSYETEFEGLKLSTKTNLETKGSNFDPSVSTSIDNALNMIMNCCDDMSPIRKSSLQK